MSAYPPLNTPAPDWAECLAPLLPYVPQQIGTGVLLALNNAFEGEIRKVVLLAIEQTLVANFGPPMGKALFADLTGAADVPNSELVGGKLSRASVSKNATRLRRGFGLPVRVPGNARAGAKPKGTPATHLDLVKSNPA